MARSTPEPTSKARRYQPAIPEEEGYAVDYGQPTEPASPYQPNASPTGGLPDTSYEDFYSRSISGSPISSLPPSSVPYYDGTDIAKQFQNNRNTEQNQGDMFQQYFGGESSRRLGLENAAALKSNQLYGQLEQTPGYSQEEIDAQMGNRPDGGNNFRDLLNVDYGSNFLTPQEQEEMRGDPYAARNELNPNILNDTNTTAFNASRGYIDNAQDKLNQNYDVTKDSLNGAIGEDLKLSGRYQDDLSNIQNVTGDKVWGAATNKDLDMSGEYGRQAGMSDQEVEDTAAIGGQALGAKYRSAVQDLERQAAASGNASPLAVAAMRSQFEDQNAVGQADAVGQLKLAARAQQRDAATGVENTRLGAERYKTNAQMGAGMDLGNMAIDAETNKENMRLNSTRDISNRRLGAASQLGQMGQQNAMYTTDANLGTERDWAGRAADAGKFNQSMAYGATRDAEAAKADRAAGIATNRQGVGFANQGNQFNRGYQVNATLADTSRGIADARRTGQAETRNYYTGQQQYQGGQAQQNNQNLLTNRQQTQQGRQAATNGSAAWELGNKNAPGGWAKHVAPVINSFAQMKPK
jgi:hypothetical protein